MELKVFTKTYFEDGHQQGWSIGLYGDFSIKIKNVTSIDIQYVCSKEEGDKINISDVFILQKK